jgi:hypothetical protein
MEPTKRARYARETITPSGYFGNGSENVVELEDMVTPEEQHYLLTFAKNNTIWDITESQWNENGNIIYDHRVWEDRVATKDTLLKADPTGKVIEILRLVIERMTPIIEEKFNVKVSPTDAAIVRWPVGAMQFPHADKELHEGPDAGTPNEFPWYDIGTVFYLNDDYEGGELFFPLQNIKFKPKPRAAYFFPGDKNYIHGVTKVTSGTRYTAPFFWTITQLGLDQNDK